MSDTTRPAADLAATIRELRVAIRTAQPFRETDGIRTALKAAARLAREAGYPHPPLKLRTESHVLGDGTRVRNTRLLAYAPDGQRVGRLLLGYTRSDPEPYTHAETGKTFLDVIERRGVPLARAQRRELCGTLTRWLVALRHRAADVQGDHVAAARDVSTLHAKLERGHTPNPETAERAAVLKALQEAAARGLDPPDWVTATRVARLDGVKVGTLGRYRVAGVKARSGLVGVDRWGRGWAKPGRNGRVRYWARTVGKNP